MNAKNCKELSNLWSLLSKTWPPANKDERKREILELLCTAAWHLQKAFELGNIPRTKLKSLIPKRVGGKTPLQLWVESGDWFDTHKTDLNFTVQSMFIADAALRLDGVLWVLRDNSGLAKNELHNSVLSDRKEMNQWLSSSAFPSAKPTILEQVMIVVAFRDSYMHGEIAGTKFHKDWPKYAAFRQTGLRDYSLNNIARYCMEVLRRFACLTTGLGNPTEFRRLLKVVSS